MKQLRQLGGDSVPYLYDIRPEVKKSADGKEADAMPEETVRVARASTRRLRPWILPTGGAFIKHPAKRYTRPAQGPAVDAPYAKPDYNDGA